ncbi:MAG TPA: AhpC/TSA family protein [Gammaproteobacteria bacterium]|nr:AhpC/TSA family protein [Gammaproteobacteria bacterium]
MSDSKTVPSYKDSLKGLIQQLGEMLPEDKLAIFNHDAEQLAKTYTSPLMLNKGDKAPSFSLPNADGKNVALDDLLQQGPVVLTFYRGTWCPYCNLELKTYQQILPKIKQAGASFVAVSPMTPDNSLQMKDSNELQFEVLSDVGNKVAGRYTTIIKNPETSIQGMADLGYDFYSFYDDTSAELPVPAIFVIAKNGTVLFAGSAGGDYRERTEPQAILDALAQ